LREGIASVFDPLGITYEITDATLDQAEIISRMSDYLLANQDKINAIIGLGDLVTGSIQRVFDQNVAAAKIPGGWAPLTPPMKSWICHRGDGRSMPSAYHLSMADGYSGVPDSMSSRHVA
jgi:hypothetical protein